MRIEAKELRDKNREKLWEVMPITTPFLVYLDPANICNIRCKFCPTGYRDLANMRDNGIMSWEIYTKIIDGCREFEKKIKRFNFYKEGEPTLNPRFIDMIQYAKQANIADQLWTKINGLRLSKEYNTELLNSGIDLVAVSIKHISSDGYFDICNSHIDYDNLLSNIKDLFIRRNGVKIYISMCNANFSDNVITKFYEDFEHISDFCAIEGLHGQSYSGGIDFKLGTSNTYDGTPLSKKIVCPLCLFSMVFNFNGTVSLCNEDWTHQGIVGNVNQSTIKEIWNSEERLAFMRMHLENRRHENKSCKDCDYISVLPDNVDNYRFQILENLK